MNKKFSTILTMVLLLVGLSFSNNAYAALSGNKKLNVIAGDAKLQDGVKFYLTDGSNGYLTVSGVKFTGGDLKDVEGVTFGTPDASSDQAALFEVCDYELIAGNSIFSLKVDGKYVYTQKDAVATADDKNEGSTIVATNKFMVVGDKLAFTSISAFLEGAKGIGVSSNPDVSFAGTDLVKPYNESAEITAADLNGLSNSVSLSFAIPTGTTLFEDNIFGQEMLAIQPKGISNLDMLVAKTIYFLVGSADKLNAVKAQFDTDGLLKDNDDAKTAILADGIKVVSLKKDKKYNISNVPAGEGMQFVMEKGADAFASLNAAKNAGFTITELDKTNNPGAYELKVTPHTDIVSPSVDLYVGAMRFTPTDAKSYITTVTEDNKDKLSLATNGISADLDASILLKNTMNVVNIYFTSGVPSTSEAADDNNTEYHKYLVAAAGASAFELQALPLDKLGGFASPFSQWVVTGFDGHNTFTFTNREASAVVNTLTLTLLPTKVAGEYKIVNSNLASAYISNIYASNANRQLINKTVKFNSIAATNPYLDLSKDEMKVPMSLSFSGKDANFGVKAFYGKFNDVATPTTYTPSAKEATANFIFAKAANDKGKTDYIQNELTYAYLDGNEVKTAKDTLFVPSYTLKAAGTEKTYLKHSLVALGDYTATSDAQGTGEFVFRKNLDGTYAMTVVNSGPAAIGAVANYAAFAVYNATAIAPDAAKTAFEKTAKFFAPVDADFSAVTLTSANADKVSLPAVGRHATFDNVLGSVAMQSVDGITEGVLKAEGLTFWLDTADSKATIPSFYISMAMPVTTKADAETEAPAERLFMYNSADSLNLFNEGGAIQKPNEAYQLFGSDDAKAIFRAATIAAIDTLTTTVDGEAAVVAKEANEAKTILGGLDNFKYNIFLADKDVEGEYLIASKNDNRYLYSLNGKLGFTADPAKALVVTLGQGESPVANEAAPSVSTVKVVATEGGVQIVGAQGKNVVITNVLGQTIANTVVSSDAATIATPAGVVIVAVEGEAAVKAIVK
ncbi:DUF6383 domain-containing protein [Parabacteroides gordonii]|uniref:DUF6383 domain-containing protein n=1 Tax=Parabacteroides gordonii TaxID=574930 RepID=UPI0026F0CAEA|nr:DUF6383 domain-containing protein [Parabacteroides gordonii]